MTRVLPVLLLFGTLHVCAQNPFDCTPLSGSVICFGHETGGSSGSHSVFVRTIDGSNNNLTRPQWGKAHIPFLRKMPARYDGDGNTMYDGVNPRTISNTLCAQTGDRPSAESLSALTFAFLQFLDHDITASVEGKTEAVNIPVPMGDPMFDPFGAGQAVIPFIRSEVMPGSGTDTRSRDQINEITAWIDGSGVYGSDVERAMWLRSGVHGTLKSTPSPNGALLPCNTPSGDCNQTALAPNAPRMASDTDRCGNRVKVFVAGDVRANEQPTLLALHTLFLREHNRLCAERVAAGHTDDEENYQYARRRVGALLQSITFHEVLPAIGVTLPPYSGYKPWVRPDIWNTFATAAYRLGHTMVTPDLWVLDQQCTDQSVRVGCDASTMGVFGGTTGCASACGSATIATPLSLRDAFFNPSIVANNGIDGLLRGAARQTQQDIDTRVIEDLRSFLFGAPGAGGLDLAALNIQRGRDHGLSKFNEVRAAFNLPPRTIAQMTTNPQLRQQLTALYGSADHIDPWIGMLAEDKLPTRSIGQTLRRVLTAQFRRLRDGDRFYYEIDPRLSYQERQAMAQTRLGDVLRRNTGVQQVDVAFFAQPCPDGTSYCDASGGSTWMEWIKRVRIHDYFQNISHDDGGYGNYTHQQFTLMRGVSTPIRLVPGYRYHDFHENWRIWIDFDRDGTFHPTQERVFQRRKRGPVSGHLDLSADRPLGTYRMRIAMSGDGSYPSPCGAITYGEVEDYTVTVTDAPNGGRFSDDFLATDPPADEAAGYERILAYPNPTTDAVTIAFQTRTPRDELQLTVTDALGRTVHTQALRHVRPGENVADLSLRHLVPGWYVVHIWGDGVRKQTRVHLVGQL